MEKKILVAVDGSVYSSNSLDYLAKLFGPDRSLSDPPAERGFKWRGRQGLDV